MALRSSMLWPLVVLWAAGCYGRPEATRDTNQAWRGRSRAALEAGWGAPGSVATDRERTVLRYARTRTRLVGSSSKKRKRPQGRYKIGALVNAAESAGKLVKRLAKKRKKRTVLVAEAWVTLDESDRVADIAGPSLHWGPPDDENMRWGTILGMHAGMGALDDTATPLPSGGAYLGGMLSRTFGLVGTFSLASGRDEAGGAMAFGWGMAAQYWASTRFWIRGGPAMILAFDPGFQDAGLEPGVNGGLSFALLRAGTFVLDLRLDLSAGTKTQFGTAGVGVHLN